MTKINFEGIWESCGLLTTLRMSPAYLPTHLAPFNLKKEAAIQTQNQESLTAISWLQNQKKPGIGRTLASKSLAPTLPALRREGFLV